MGYDYDFIAEIADEVHEKGYTYLSDFENSDDVQRILGVLNGSGLVLVEEENDDVRMIAGPKDTYNGFQYWYRGLVNARSLRESLSDASDCAKVQLGICEATLTSMLTESKNELPPNKGELLAD